MSELPKASIEFRKSLEIQKTSIPGLLLLDLPVMDDDRGWFKENYNQEKMSAKGLPYFDAVQNNISFNVRRGVTRGIHAEPWNKYISLATGRIFGAWVDLREGDTFGTVFTTELDPSKAIFVPRGVGNGFQALEDGTAYSYLVDDHWSLEAKSQYTFLNLADATADIKWPIAISESELSDDDKNHPELSHVVPMKPKKILITGANGQLGQALRTEFPDAEFTTREDFDVTSADLETSRLWRQYSAIINAAAYTKVDPAETSEGRVEAWRANAESVANLGKIATKFNVTLVHISSDYVFDGTKEIHTEDEPYSPLGVYGQSKAAGDIAASQVPNHYTLRTSWVIGEGNNFVRTMHSLAEKGIAPKVVNDQIGRLTFTSDLAKGIKHLLTSQAPYGTYNLSSEGDSASWADVASEVYRLTGHNSEDVTGVSTAEYYAGKDGIAPRPLQSTLDLGKIESTGFTPQDWREALSEYLKP